MQSTTKPESTIIDGEVVFDTPSHALSTMPAQPQISLQEINLSLFWGGIALGIIAGEALRYASVRNISDLFDS